jgi:hypothetical protein
MVIFSVKGFSVAGAGVTMASFGAAGVSTTGVGASTINVEVLCPQRLQVAVTSKTFPFSAGML